MAKATMLSMKIDLGSEAFYIANILADMALHTRDVTRFILKIDSFLGYLIKLESI